MKFNNSNKTQENFLPIILDASSNSNRIRITPRTANEITIFLDDDILAPNQYRDEFHTIINAGEYDEINIIINTSGGQLDTAQGFKEVINSCNGSVTAILMGECSSAGTIIALSCPQVAVLDSATFMIHTAKFGYGGNTNNVKDYVDFTHGQIHRMIDEVYSGFLTKAEIEQVKLGKEFWFDAGQIRTRLGNRAKFVNAKAKKETKVAKMAEVKEILENIKEGQPQ